MRRGFYHPQDPRKALKDLAQHATRYNVSLDGLVSRDNAYILRGGGGVVCSGTVVDRDGKLDKVEVADGDFRKNRHGRKVAIKIPRAGPPCTEANIKKFLEEVYIWSKLDHENILPLLGITLEFDMTVSMVSAWMEKGNARAYVQDKAIDPRSLIDGIARGLHYLHNHEPNAIFHGDFKGVNVLISDNGRALLTDFGFSHIMNSSFSLTVSSHGGGECTLKWKSPELLQGGVVSAKADVWAFGMTALELFTREDPFHGFPTFASIMFRIIMGGPDRPTASDTCDRMTDDWWDICSRCWQYTPAARPTMLDIVETITKIIN
ncbi:hypothetical protein SCLCIDRAFT_909920 [Scleroderma citrinum Foug A]|uniref:Protein kinase domain-containing protein n=1 Tax=Scleroderma citrinum Foug A TaxID=1036808 RepID=A0A0C3DYE0_9AGAM|nr:hypothetical protein SCLCIDRAFT_909920 [Scleroderma citrinum Foug A]